MGGYGQISNQSLERNSGPFIRVHAVVKNQTFQNVGFLLSVSDSTEFRQGLWQIHLSISKPQ